MEEQWKVYLNEFLNQKKTLNDSDKHSEENDNADKPCDKCERFNGYYWVVDEAGNDALKECECGYLKRQRDKSRLKFASIPAIYKNYRLVDINELYSKNGNDIIKAVSELSKWYIENLDKQKEEGKGLYFWSDKKGSGKTMTMCCIANELCDRGISVKFATSPQILNEIKASWNREEQISESELLRQFSTTEILIIDDFGTEQARDWVSERFYQIIDNRYRNNMITLFTSNHEPKNLPYGERITNRVIERSLIIHFPEESVREKISAINNLEVKQMFPGAFS